MKESIAFYKRQIYDHESASATGNLSKLAHPDAIDALFEIAQSNKLSDTGFQLLLPELIKSGDPRTADIVIDYLQSRDTIFYLLLFYLELLDDPRLVPELARFIELVVSGQVTQNDVTSCILIETYAQLGGQASLPLLEKLIHDFPFESENDILPEKPFAIMAMDALREIDSPEARELLKKWQTRFDTHLAYHLQHNSIFKIDVWFSKNDETLLLIRPMVIDDLLAKFSTIDMELQLRIINAIGRNLPILSSNHDKIYRKVISFFIDYAQNTSDHAIRLAIMRHFTQYSSGQSIPLALQTLEDKDLQIYSVKILCNQKYTEAAPRIFNILRGLSGMEIAGAFFDYLVMLGTADAEKMLIEIAVGTDKSEELHKVYRALAQMAKTSETAFNILSRIIDDMPLEDQKVAIGAFKITGEPAIGLLLSFLQNDSPLQSAAIYALASPVFVDALPYLIQLLLDSEFEHESPILKTLEAIGTESAFAAINTWLDNNA